MQQGQVLGLHCNQVLKDIGQSHILQRISIDVLQRFYLYFFCQMLYNSFFRLSRKNSRTKMTKMNLIIFIKIFLPLAIYFLVRYTGFHLCLILLNRRPSKWNMFVIKSLNRSILLRRELIFFSRVLHNTLNYKRCQHHSLYKIGQSSIPRE